MFVVLLILLNILWLQYAGFEVNDFEIKYLNSIAEITYIVGIVALLTVSNWSVTTLFDGKGKMKDIFLMICYSLYPMIWANIFGIVLSNILTGEEITIYYLIMSLGGLLTGYMVFMGLISIHEYGLGKCLVTILVTLLAASIIIFILLLSFNLFQTVYGFFYQIYQEITLRNII
jgi:hypothetical protein